MRKLTHEELTRKRPPAEALKNRPRHPIYVLLDNIRSLYNVGSIFRTCDGARIEQLVLTGFTPYPPRKEIEKTALGATSTVPWIYERDPLVALNRLKSQGVKVCALEHTDESIHYSSLSPDNFPICIIVGSEVSGISKDVIAQCDIAVEIPMHGMKQSLNAAVAFGVVVFAFVRMLKS